MGCLCRRRRLQSVAIEARVHDLAIGLYLGAFAVEDAHDLSEMENLGGVGRMSHQRTDSMAQIQVGCREALGTCTLNTL